MLPRFPTYPIEQFSALQQLANQVRITLIMHHFVQSHGVGMPLACSQQINLLRAIGRLADYLHGKLSTTTFLHTSTTDGKRALTEYLFRQVDVVGFEKGTGDRRLVVVLGTGGFELAHRVIDLGRDERVAFEDFVVVGRDYCRRVGRRHRGKLIAKVGHVQFGSTQKGMYNILLTTFRCFLFTRFTYHGNKLVV